MSTIDILLVDDTVDLAERVTALTDQLPVRYVLMAHSEHLGVTYLRFSGESTALVSVALRGRVESDYADILTGLASPHAVALLFGERNGTERAMTLARYVNGLEYTVTAAR